jgi:peptidoglycan/xylan/chitin deacetylase (PgdA/CDA1 family)
MTSLQSVVLYCIRALGGFSLAQYLTRRRLRILCYHGFSIGDEHAVMPLMFMRAETFERRMRILKKRHVPVIALDEAIRKFQQHEIRNAETVLTLDDGWSSNLTIGVPILQKYSYPACIYLSTEHLAADTAVFNVILSYMIQQSKKDTLTLKGVHLQLDGTYDLRRDPEAVTVALISAAQEAFPLAERQQQLGHFAAALGMDLDEVLKDGRFRLLERAGVEELFRRGIDIQLHTHTHRLPDHDFEAMAREISENRNAIKEIVGAEPHHFCYPSGIYTDQQAEWLQRLGIDSATTCDPGLNDPNTSVMRLKRYLDSEEASDIAFEAEICGVRELARIMRTAASRLLRG